MINIEDKLFIFFSKTILYKQIIINHFQLIVLLIQLYIFTDLLESFKCKNELTGEKVLTFETKQKICLCLRNIS